LKARGRFNNAASVIAGPSCRGAMLVIAARNRASSLGQKTKASVSQHTRIRKPDGSRKPTDRGDQLESKGQEEKRSVSLCVHRENNKPAFLAGLLTLTLKT